jgi:hypothetical protein
MEKRFWALTDRTLVALQKKTGEGPVFDGPLTGFNNSCEKVMPFSCGPVQNLVVLENIHRRSEKYQAISCFSG